MQQQNMQTIKIQCKVQFGQEFRRFALTTSSYASLLDQLKASFSTDESLTIKYKDEESDLITISSDAELVFAIELFTGSVLRLIVSSNRGGRGKCHWGEKRCGMGMGRGRGKWCEKLKANPELLKQKVDTVQWKLSTLRERKQSFESEENSTHPNNAQRLAWIQEKIRRLEGRLAFLQAVENSSVISEELTTPVESSVSQNQATTPSPSTHSWEEHKAVRENLMREIIALKEQIMAKKEAVQIAKQNGQPRENIKKLWEEMGELRLLISDKKAEMKGSRDQFIAAKKACKATKQ